MRDEGKPPAFARVLVVDASVDCRRRAAVYLDRAGYRVDIVGSGFDALLVFGIVRYDLVLLDVALPDTDGCEVARRFREYERPLGRHTPVIAVTAREHLERCRAGGLDGFLDKPYTREDLYEVIGAVTAALRANTRRRREAGFVTLAPGRPRAR